MPATYFPRRILITGATGFVGGWLAERIAPNPANLSVYGTAHRATSREQLPEGVAVYPIDLTDREAVNGFVGEVGPDLVFHLAGFASGTGTDRNVIFAANVEGTVNLLNALVANGRPCRVLLASSGYVYGATAAGTPATESAALHPQGMYAESKRAMEEAAFPFVESGLLSLTVTRSFNHTGPRQTADFVVPAFARQIARIEKGLEPPVVRHGNLDAYRDFLDVRDVVRAYWLLMLQEEQAPWRVVNVASGVGGPIRGILEQLIDLARVEVSQENDPARMRPSDLPECVGSPEYLQQLTGWKPDISLKRTLSDTLDWWRGQTASAEE